MNIAAVKIVDASTFEKAKGTANGRELANFLRITFYYTFLMKRILTSFIILLLLNSSCENTKSNNKQSVDSLKIKRNDNEYLNKYSGGYTVELDNVLPNTSAEVYILKSDGTAKWMYIKNDGGNAEIESEKLGDWSATETSITITCAGNSGSITEDFKLKDGRFYDTLTGERYLRLKQ